MEGLRPDRPENMWFLNLPVSGKMKNRALKHDRTRPFCSKIYTSTVTRSSSRVGVVAQFQFPRLPMSENICTVKAPMSILDQAPDLGLGPYIFGRNRLIVGALWLSPANVDASWVLLLLMLLLCTAWKIEKLEL